MSAKDNDKDMIHAFCSGGDDYVIKPFSVTELSLRMYALLRRSKPDFAEKNMPETLKLEHQTFDYPNRMLCSEQDQVNLTKKEADVLRMLATNVNSVVKREKVLTDIWGPEARMLMITPFDKGAMPAIERSIQDSNLGLNPSNDGITVRLAFPPLTEERRKEFVKLVKSKAEDGRTAVRGARRDARKDLEALEKGGDISTDDLRRAEAELDRMTKTHEAEIDEALDAKTVELMEG